MFKLFLKIFLRESRETRKVMKRQNELLEALLMAMPKPTDGYYSWHTDTDAKPSLDIPDYEEEAKEEIERRIKEEEKIFYGKTLG